MSFAQATETTKTSNNRLTPERLKELDLAKRSDGHDEDWVELYLAEFPKEEQRDVSQLRAILDTGKLVLHETRDKNGLLLTWSMTQNCQSDSKNPSFWLGCWTVTRRDYQSSGIGRVHFAKLLEALKAEKPDYIGRITEIESTAGLTKDSQPARRARFYKALGLQELDIPYEIPLFQPADATEYVPQAKLGKSIKGQLLISMFSDSAVSASQLRYIVGRIYKSGYHVKKDDPYFAERLALIDEKRENYLTQIKTPE